MLPLPSVIWAICFRCIYFELFSMGFRFFKGFIVISKIYKQIINLIMQYFVQTIKSKMQPNNPGQQHLQINQTGQDYERSDFSDEAQSHSIHNLSRNDAGHGTYQNGQNKLSSVVIYLAIFVVIGAIIIFTMCPLVGCNFGNKQILDYKFENSLDKQKLEATLLSRAHNLRSFKNLYEFLNHNKIDRVLQINTDIKSEDHFKKWIQFPEILVDSWDGVQISQFYAKKMVDWINCESFEFCIQLFLKYKSLMGGIGYGVAFTNSQINEFDKPEMFSQIIKHFVDHGFYYDEIKSLSLFRAQNKMVMIFIKGTPEQKVLPFKKPNKNVIAIHVIVRMIENIEYLREWIGYHLNLGVDKFFIYDSSNAVKSDNAKYKNVVSAKKTKNGLSLDCFNITKEQIKRKWQKIWLDFYQHIVYIPWQPKNKNGEIIYGQIKALKDYTFYFKHVIKFTAYIDPDQFLFSADNYDLEQYLHKKQNENVTTLRIVSRHFPHRVCGPNKRVTDLVDYYPHNLENLTDPWAPKIICITKYFQPWGSIHDGNTLKGARLTPPDHELRFNHYNLEYFSLYTGVEFKFSNRSELVVDDSLPKRYGKVIDEICKSDQCSENFAISCPPGQQFLYCINPKDKLPVTLEQAKQVLNKLDKKAKGQ